MAILKGSKYQMTGKFGNSVIKVMDGTMYVSSKPSHYTKPNDADALKRNDDFLFASKLASAIKKMPALLYLWNVHRKIKRIYQVILRDNKTLISDGTERSNIQMVPAESVKLSLSVKEIGSGEDKIIVTINPPGVQECIDPFYEPTILGNMILCGVNPSSEKDKYLFLSVISEYKAVQLNEEMSFSFPPTPAQLFMFNHFPERRIYLTFITLGRNGEPIRSSQLYSWRLDN